MEHVESIVRGVIVGSPYGRRLGVVCEAVEADRVRLRLPYASELTTIADVVHGGAIASLVDVAATAACWASPSIDGTARGTTIGFSINYLAAARGRDLIASAEVIQRGGSISVCDVHVHDTGGTPVARATVTYKLSSKGTRAHGRQP